MSERVEAAKYEWHEAITSCGTINRGIAKANWASCWAEELLTQLAAAEAERDNWRNDFQEACRQRDAAEARERALREALAYFEHELERDYMDRLTIVNNVPIPLNIAVLRLWDRLRAALTQPGVEEKP